MSLTGKRILIAKPGLDGHDAGAKVIALALRDAGAEVIYTGIRKSPDYIARVAIEEDVDAVGLSILSGSHVGLVEDTARYLREFDGGDIPIFVGGTIPERDKAALIEAGARGIFSAVMRIEDVVASIDRTLSCGSGHELTID